MCNITQGRIRDFGHCRAFPNLAFGDLRNHKYLKRNKILISILLSGHAPVTGLDPPVTMRYKTNVITHML